MGRAKKTISNLPEGWIEHVLTLYSEGASDVEIKAYFAKEMGSFSNDLFERMVKEHEVFSETIKKGRLLSQAWWEEHGRAYLNDKAFNSVLWYMNMQNRFKWRNNTQDEHKVSGNITINFNPKIASSK